jgi:hypothetical protein
MKKFKDLSLSYQAISVYLLSLFVSLILYSPFYNIYIFIFKPIIIGGSLYTIFPEWFERIFGATMFAYFLVLPFFIFLLTKKKQRLIWLVGIIVPLLIFLLNGLKHFLWALILSAIGWGLAKGILLIKGRK